MNSKVAWELAWLSSFFGFMISGIGTGIYCIYLALTNQFIWYSIPIIIGGFVMTLMLCRTMDNVKIHIEKIENNVTSVAGSHDKQ